MAQDCFLTFGIRRQMIMMQPGKLSILPLESKQWGVGSGTITFPVSFGMVFSVLASPVSRTSSLETGYVISKQSNTGITIRRIILWDTQANGGDLSGSSKYNWVAMGVA